jgi:type IV secretory pathway VirB2 component (pilin)
MINNFIPLMNTAVVVTFIITGIRLLWGKSGWKDSLPTFIFGSLLCAFANKPILLSKFGTIIIGLVENIGKDINI